MDKLQDLMNQAKAFLNKKNAYNNRLSLWRAYISLEYAILYLKLKYKMRKNHILPAARNKNRRMQAKNSLNENRSIDECINVIKSKLERIDFSDEETLLVELRSCRDLLKILIIKSWS